MVEKESTQRKKEKKPINTQTLTMTNREQKPTTQGNSHKVSISWTKAGSMV